MYKKDEEKKKISTELVVVNPRLSADIWKSINFSGVKFFSCSKALSIMYSALIIRKMFEIFFFLMCSTTQINRQALKTLIKFCFYASEWRVMTTSISVRSGSGGTPVPRHADLCAAGPHGRGLCGRHSYGFQEHHDGRSVPNVNTSVRIPRTRTLSTSFTRIPRASGWEVRSKFFNLQ